MRLNADHKESIVLQATKKAEKRVVDARKRYQRFALKDAKGCPKLRKRMDNMPKGYFQQRHRISVALPDHRYEAVQLNPWKTNKVVERPTVNSEQPLNCPYELPKVVPSQFTKDAWFELVDRVNEYQSLLFDLGTRLKSVKTVKQLLELWPESEKYVTGFREKPTMAVAIIFDDIKERLER